MNAWNDMFFREYTRLDRMCKDAYGTEKGISNYIDLMKQTSATQQRRISNWDDDFRNLIRLRHIRNQLAHDPGAFDKEMCTQGDIQWLEDFYARMLNRKDPLAQLRQTQTFQPKMGTSWETGNYEVYSEERIRLGCSTSALFWGIVLLALICIATALSL